MEATKGWSIQSLSGGMAGLQHKQAATLGLFCR